MLIISCIASIDFKIILRYLSFNRKFFYDTPNRLEELFPDEKKYSDKIRLIRVDDFSPGGNLELVMDDEIGQAVAYIKTTLEPQEDL